MTIQINDFCTVETESRTCSKCGKNFEHEIVKGNDIFKGISLDRKETPCPDCIEKAKQQRIALDRKEAKDREERQRSKRHTLAQRIIPPQYFDTDLQSEEFNHQLWQKVADFSFSKPRLWLGIVGESGSCKTRSACQKLKEEILRSGSGHFLPALELGNFASNQQTAEQREAFYNEKKKAKECALLVLDDLGKLGPTPTPARAKVLFEILEHRLSYNLPLIWTANLSLEETFRCYPEEYGPTTSGRLLEASHIIA